MKKIALMSAVISVLNLLSAGTTVCMDEKRTTADWGASKLTRPLEKMMEDKIWTGPEEMKLNFVNDFIKKAISIVNDHYLDQKIITTLNEYKDELDQAIKNRSEEKFRFMLDCTVETFRRRIAEGIREKNALNPAK